VSAELTDRVATWRERGEETGFDGHRIHLFSRAGEGPTLLLLHGFPTCSYDWRLLIELLSERAVIAPDFLGYGFSEKPADHDYTLVESADLAEEVIRRQAPAAPVFAIGHDIGTSVANELMARDIDGALGFDLTGVLLLNGSMVQDAASPTLGQRLLRGRLGPLVSRLSSERFFRDQFGSIFSAGHPLTEQEADDQWSLISYGGGQRIAHRLIRYMDERMERAERWHGAIREWSGPLSIAWGMVDPVATPDVLAAVRDLRPAAPVTEWDDLGHYPHLEDPARVSAALLSALDASL
jgi:pimeloyl-ACP methyl ester carboxylesterase